MAFIHGIEIVESQDGARPIRTVRSAVIGLIGTAPDADAAAFPINTPVLIAGSRTEAAKLDLVGDGEGTLPNAIDGIFDQAGAFVVVVRVEEGADEASTITNVIGGVDGVTGALEGVHVFLGAESVTGLRPRLLVAPLYSADAGVLAEIEPIAEKMRSIVIADGPNTTDAEVIAVAEGTDSRRVFLTDPFVKVSRAGVEVAEPGSPRIAGLIAKSDNDRGFWWSPSNNPISGIIGTDRPIDYVLGESTSRANLLNEKGVATIINLNGYRCWGNLTLSSDPKWQFLSVVRTADIINDSIMEGHIWAIDRPITKTYLEDVAEGVNNYLATLVSLGAILGGRCWPDPELNTPANIQLGKVYFNFDFTPPYPAQHITFTSILTADYLEILNQ